MLRDKWSGTTATQQWEAIRHLPLLSVWPIDVHSRRQALRRARTQNSLPRKVRASAAKDNEPKPPLPN